MNKRRLNGIDIIPIGFGTSTFVQGKLCPDADSNYGIELLRFVAEHGITVTHSAKNLQTQWGIKESLSTLHDKNQFQHIVKIKIGKGFEYSDLEKLYYENASSVGFGIVLLQLEFDKSISVSEKKVIIANLINKNVKNQFPLYLHLTSESDASSYVGLKGLSGYSAKYSDCKMWLEKYIHLIEKNNQDFVIFAPFSHRNPDDSIVSILQECLFYQGVKCIILSSKNYDHWIENINIALGVCNDYFGNNI